VAFSHRRVTHDSDVMFVTVVDNVLLTLHCMQFNLVHGWRWSPSLTQTLQMLHAEIRHADRSTTDNVPEKPINRLHTSSTDENTSTK